jgi:hypothetical protein
MSKIDLPPKVLAEICEQEVLQRLDRGYTRQQILDDMYSRGWSEIMLEPAVDDAFAHKEERREEGREARYDEGGGMVLLGVLAIVAGIAITWVSYNFAAFTGRYIVAFGLVIFGVISIVRGLIQMVMSR